MDNPEPGSCPVCGKAGAPRYRPFCSARCADVDLGRWFSGQYRVAGAPAPQEDAPGDDGEG